MKERFQAGVGKAAFCFPVDFLPVEGFTTITDDIHARVLLLKGNIQFALLSLEMTSFPGKAAAEFKHIVSELTGILEEHIWVCATHTFSAPHIRPPFALKSQEDVEQNSRYLKIVKEAIEKAVRRAMEDCEEARIGFGAGMCQVNVARDIETRDGWWIGSNLTGPVDPTVLVIKITDSDGKTKALLANYAVQSSVMDGEILADGGKTITSDLAGRACAYVEKEQNCISIFLIGAAGDQVPLEKAVQNMRTEEGDIIEIHRKEEGLKLVELFGNALGREIIKTGESISDMQEELLIRKKEAIFTVPGKQMNHDLQKLHPVKQGSYAPDKAQTASVETLLLNDTALVGVKPELNQITAESIRQESPYNRTFILTMVNGAAKYLADKASYRKFTYEAQNSPFAEGGAEILSSQAIKLLKEMKAEETNQ